MFDVIERLKAEWTDKYVVIDSPAPELSRFAKTTGTVRAVNMNGRCLVEFDQFNNIAWYDIDPSHLKIVTEPLPKPEKQAKAKAKPAAKQPPPKTATTKKPSTAEKLEAGRDIAANPTGKQSAAALLAAARGGVTKPDSKPTAADILAKARGVQKPPPTQVNEPTTKDHKLPDKMQDTKVTATEILEKASGAQKQSPAPIDESETGEPESPEETTGSYATPEQDETPQAKESPAGKLPTTTAEKIAWCRQNDAQ